MPRRAQSIRRAAFRLSAYLNYPPRAVFVQSAARKAPKTTTTTHHYRKKPRRRIINSSEKVAIAAEQSAKHALDSTRAILASLGGDVSETEKKADSLE